MGRVRRYKKLKACDPCARGRGSAQCEEDAKYDMAPSGLDSDEERFGGTGGGQKRRRQERRWAKDALRDNEYIEELESQALKKRKKQLPQASIQPKQPNESMKAFQHRVRQDQKALLRESNLANSTTKTRRREYMKKKKQDKKRKAQGLPALPDPRAEVEDKEEEEEHGERASQRAWMGPVPSFARAESITFGERNDAPPNLRLPRLPYERKAQAQSVAAAEARQKQTGKERVEKRELKRWVTGRKEEGQSAAAAAARTKQPPAEKAKWARLREEAQQAYRTMKEGKQGSVKT